MNETYKQQQARKYLEAIKGLEDYLNALREAEAKEWEAATSTTPRPAKDSAILGTTIDRPSGVSRAAESYAEKRTRTREIEAELQASYSERIETINKLRDNMHKAILTYHYINGRTWEKTGEAVGFSTSHVQVIAAQALTELYNVLPESAKRF